VAWSVGVEPMHVVVMAAVQLSPVHLDTLRSQLLAVASQIMGAVNCTVLYRTASECYLAAASLGLLSLPRLCMRCRLALTLLTPPSGSAGR
jgi:hypothetical protein